MNNIDSNLNEDLNLNISENRKTVDRDVVFYDSYTDSSGLDGNAMEVPKKFLLSRNAPTYELELEKCTKNAMIIFNQENFLSPCDKREGSWKDVKALRETFEPFKFKVFTCDDYEEKYLLDTLKGFVWERNYDAYGCICVVLLTHGNDGTLSASDRSFPEEEFFDCFDVRKNPTLAGKPIIIIVQACRGGGLADAVEVEVELPMEDDDGDDPRFIYLPTSADMLILRSCSSNTASVRIPDSGSWLIQSLCRQIKLNPEQDFEIICREVRREVALKATNYNGKQMPVVTSTLIRQLFLKQGFRTDSPGNSGPLGMPSTYFLQYFKYIKKCLRLYIHGNKNDRSKVVVARILLQSVETAEHDTVDKQLLFIHDIYKHLKSKADNFPEFNFVYFHYLITESA